MLSADVLHELIDAVDAAEADLLELLSIDAVRQEDDITSRLSHGVRLFTRRVDNVQISMNVIDGVGPGAAENTVGADIIGAININVDGASMQKGFVAQAKKAGDDGLYFRPWETRPPAAATTPTQFPVDRPRLCPYGANFLAQSR